MELSLYNITSAFPKLMECEELTDEERKQLKEELQQLLVKKSGNIIGYTKNIELTINAIKEEEKRLYDNRKALENQLEKFKIYVKECMQNSNIDKITTELGTLYVAKNPVSVEIVNEDIIPKQYKKQIVETKIDKKAIIADFKSTGELIDGVVFHTDEKGLRIK